MGKSDKHLKPIDAKLFKSFHPKQSSRTLVSTNKVIDLTTVVKYEADPFQVLRETYLNGIEAIWHKVSKLFTASFSPKPSGLGSRCGRKYVAHWQSIYAVALFN